MYLTPQPGFKTCLVIFLPVEESCKELKAGFVRLRYLDRRLKATYVTLNNSGDEKRAAAVLSLLKDGISRLRVEFERLQEDVLESELNVEQCSESSL